MKSVKVTLVLILLAILLLACRAESGISASEAGIKMTLEMVPNLAVVGETLLMVGITDTSGQSIENIQNVTVRGDMNHAGMTPVIREVKETTDGVYHVPFEWTMGSEWIVIVEALLADDQLVSERFDLFVSSESMSENKHDKQDEHEH